MSPVPVRIEASSSTCPGTRMRRPSGRAGTVPPRLYFVRPRPAAFDQPFGAGAPPGGSGASISRSSRDGRVGRSRCRCHPSPATAAAPVRRQARASAGSRPRPAGRRGPAPRVRGPPRPSGRPRRRPGAGGLGVVDLKISGLACPKTGLQAAAFPGIRMPAATWPRGPARKARVSASSWSTASSKLHSRSRQGSYQGRQDHRPGEKLVAGSGAAAAGQGGAVVGSGPSRHRRAGPRPAGGGRPGSPRTPSATRRYDRDGAIQQRPGRDRIAAQELTPPAGIGWAEMAGAQAKAGFGMGLDHDPRAGMRLARMWPASRRKWPAWPAGQRTRHRRRSGRSPEHSRGQAGQVGIVDVVFRQIRW
jgi:translation initiation factor IF-2